MNINHPTSPFIEILAAVLAYIIAIIVHEFSHAYMADRLGDPTPRLQGRLTLHPKAHIDLWGTIIIPLVLFVSSQGRFFFGWAKPVQFDPFNLRKPRRDAAIISLAGPISNFLLATLASLALHALLTLPLSLLNTVYIGVLLNFLVALVMVNIVLAVFNLLPIHPLDGFKIVGGFLSEENAKQWYSLERLGYIILIALLLTPALSNLITPPISFLLRLLLPQAPLI